MGNNKYSDLTLEDIRKLPWNPLRQELIEYACDTKSNFNYAVTLTFERELTTRSWAKKYGIKFQQFYNNAFGMYNWKRKSKKDKRQRAPIIAVLEDDFGTKRLHYHMLLSKPKISPNEMFEELVQKAWRRTGNGSKLHNEFKPIYNLAGWAAYTTKEISSTSTDVLHAELTHTFTEKPRETWELKKARKAGNAKMAEKLQKPQDLA